MSVPKLAVLLAVVLAGCRAADRTNQATGDEPANEAEEAAPASLPTVAAPLTRRDLLLAATEAASDFSAGINDDQRQQELDGRQFAFRIRFCDGDEGSGSFRRSFDETTRVWRLVIEPDIDAGLPFFRVLGGPEIEAVEGFWVPRPWLLRAACPARPEPPNEEVTAPAPLVKAVPASPTVGLAEFFGDATPRSPRRGDRPYFVTRRVEPGEEPGPVDLLIEGRLQKGPGGKVISCVGEVVAAPPTCIISVRMDQVSLVQPDGTVLARWGGS